MFANLSCANWYLILWTQMLIYFAGDGKVICTVKCCSILN